MWQILLNFWNLPIIKLCSSPRIQHRIFLGSCSVQARSWIWWFLWILPTQDILWSARPRLFYLMFWLHVLLFSKLCLSSVQFWACPKVSCCFPVLGWENYFSDHPPNPMSHEFDLDLDHFLTLKEPMDCTIQTRGREEKIKTLLKTNGKMEHNGKVS